ncbi:MAG: hypothetical protein GY941_29410, partial [Planctomycetes bacterium]|nr:hypothetical protein [Planctomycetota bacterium]
MTNHYVGFDIRGIHFSLIYIYSDLASLALLVLTSTSKFSVEFARLIMADDAKINSLSSAASDLNLDQHNQKPNLSPTDVALNNMECDPPMSNADHNKPQQHCQNITHGVNALNITSNNLDKTAQQ